MFPSPFCFKFLGPLSKSKSKALLWFKQISYRIFQVTFLDGEWDDSRWLHLFERQEHFFVRRGYSLGYLLGFTDSLLKAKILVNVHVNCSPVRPKYRIALWLCFRELSKVLSFFWILLEKCRDTIALRFFGVTRQHCHFSFLQRIF